MSYGAHRYISDDRNADILISVNGALYPRSEACISVFDSGFILGDGVWEGLRVHEGVIVFLRAHLDRLYSGARALDFEVGVSPRDLCDRLYGCLDANGMRDGVHIRLMVTRGIKSTPYQDPRVTVSPATIVMIPEYKRVSGDGDGLRLFTSTFRRTGPDQQDQKLNSHSKLNCIQACIQASKAGADEALMLDSRGFVATCNSTHFFIIRRGAVWTSGGGYCLGGITRGVVIELCRAAGIPVFEKDFSLVDVYSADGAFVTGTFAGIVAVHSVDGRTLGDPLGSDGGGCADSVIGRLRDLYAARIAEEVARGVDIDF